MLIHLWVLLHIEVTGVIPVVVSASLHSVLEHHNGSIDGLWVVVLPLTIVIVQLLDCTVVSLIQ